MRLLPVVIFVLLALACSSQAAPPENSASVPSATASQRPDFVPLLKGPVSPDGLQAIFATPDLGVGENRVAFVLTSPTQLVRSPAVTVSSVYFPADGSPDQRKETTLALFHKWPLEARGMYSTLLAFDEPGRWGLDITVLDPDGTGRQAQLFFDVKPSPSAPAIGLPAVRSRSKTIHDVERISQLTTGSLHDPELYQTTISQAVDSALPTVVVMASPAFCTSAVCGPQVEVLQELKEKYRGQANFIHVDFYDNPEEIQGDLNRAVLSPTVIEWALPSSEWSFVIDRSGIIAARFEGFATLEELEQALLLVL